MTLQTRQDALTLALVERAPQSVWWLPADERAAHDRLRTEERRAEFRAGRLAARLAVGALLGRTDALNVEIRPLPGRPPAVVLPSANSSGPSPWLNSTDGTGAQAPEVRVSIAHRMGRAVAAASFDPVGVDIELDGAVPPGRLRFFLTAAERTYCSGRSPTELWALKEAAWKALELASDLPLSAIELIFDKGGAVVGVASEGRGHRTETLLRRLAGGLTVAVVRLPDSSR